LEERNMRIEHDRPVPAGAQPLGESRAAWMGPAEAARQEALLRVNGGLKADRREGDRRQGDRRDSARG
jgi:hypothetical protein